jgi:hypothetical protein
VQKPEGNSQGFCYLFALNPFFLYMRIKSTYLVKSILAIFLQIGVPLKLTITNKLIQLSYVN